MAGSPIHRIPVDCPRCRKTLYPIAAFRPRVRTTLPAGLLMPAGGTVATAVLIVGGVTVQQALLGTAWAPLSRLAGVAMVVPAVFAGMPFVWLAYRLPRVVRLRCRTCGWGEAFRRR